jgi:serine/threonine protein kinase
MLNKLRRVDHEHLIKRIAAIAQNGRYFVLLEWADGGDLLEYWDKNPKPKLSANLINEFLAQFYGLASAIDTLHNRRTDVMQEANTGSQPSSRGTDTGIEGPHPFIMVESVSEEPLDSAGGIQQDALNPSGNTPEAAINIRHGDLKPENILRFLKPETLLGLLVISDLGLAKEHKVQTSLRKVASSARYGTIHYEPPEAVTQSEKPRSRRYDLWSMGCIILETVIYLLHGKDGLNRFWKANQPGGSLYYTRMSRTTAVVNDYVSRLIEDLLRNDPECNGQSGSALRDLLVLVKEKLLVVELPRDIDSQPGCRISAEDLRQELAHIIQKAGDDTKYLHPGKSRANVQLPAVLRDSNIRSARVSSYRTGPLLKPPSIEKLKIPTAVPSKQSSSLMVPGTGPKPNRDPRETYRHVPLNQDDWEFQEDNKFALPLLRKIDGFRQATSSTDVSKLCHRCRKLNFQIDFNLEESLSDLEPRVPHCDFCKLLFRTWKSYNRGDSGVSKFRKVGTSVRIPREKTPVLNICTLSGKLLL